MTQEISEFMFTKKVFYTSLLLMFMLFDLTVNAQEKLVFERQTTSFIQTGTDKDGYVFTRTVDRRFNLARFYLPSKPDAEVKEGSVLLLEEFDITRILGAEGTKGIVTVEGWKLKDNKPIEKIWTIKQEGHDGTPWDEMFYKVTKHGCCATLASDVYFNLLTGERLYTTTSRPLQHIIIPNTGARFLRFIAYSDHNGSFLPVEIKAEEDWKKFADVLAVLQYGSSSQVQEKVLIRTKLDVLANIKFIYQNKVVSDKDLMLWGVDGKERKSALSDFSIVISFHFGGDSKVREIIIPVKNDKLDLANATVPERFKLEQLDK